MSLAQLSVMVVEDHPFQRDVLLALLRRIGVCQLSSVSDGAAALAQLQTTTAPIDIVLTDLEMPGMDGIELVRRICESALRPAVIILSAHGSNLLAAVETMAEAYGLRLLGVLTKPATADAMTALLTLHQTAAPAPAARAVGSELPTADQIAEGLARGEFEPFFQPKVRMDTGELSGFEALARWRHPQFGLRPPSVFVPTLESAGLSGSLAMTMLQQAARQCQIWRDAGLDISVAVNLSVDSLRDVAVADQLADQVKQTGLPFRHMVLEVTESAAIGQDVGAVLDNLSRLRLKGFGLALDDYGTGYASMQQLTRIPFTELKIDQSFVRGALRQSSHRHLLEASLAMAEKLRLTAVAEGVESEEEWRLLQELRCGLAQGYFIGAPMAADQLFPWLHQWRARAAQLSAGGEPTRNASR